MNVLKHYAWLTLALVIPLIVIFALITSIAAASPADSQTQGVDPERQPSRASLSSTDSKAITATASSQTSPVQTLPPQRSLQPEAAGDVLEVFTNTWSYSTLGLVYDPDRNLVRYAHESQSSKHNPTIYDVNLVDHTVEFNVAFSAVNSNWPWQIDNRDGAGYDYATGTFFLPDYNGDQSYADDNIIEIDREGHILNAWEMDNDVGSNDSSDGTKIDSIIDIAVVPGDPTRYFVTAAYDGRKVYKIDLVKTGKWWTPESWSTLATYTVPGFTSKEDNLGIDYDAKYGRLYHSSWDSGTIVVTDLDMNFIASFDCLGVGGYNSGVTFIESSDPPEVWVTDFSSDKTTRCKAIGEPLPEAGWSKQVDGTPWVPDLTVTTETSDTIQAMDVITAARPFTLSMDWDPTKLELIDLNVNPPMPNVITATGSLTVTGGEDVPEVITVTKSFLVQPSTWTQTVVTETLTITDTDFDQTQRPFTVAKLAPQLAISSDYDTEVSAGGLAFYTLVYSNTGGFENDVEIRSTFPVTAPLIYADPSPNRQADDGSWAEWDAGNMSTNDQGNIDVYVYIDETLSVSNTVTISSGIYNHVDELKDSADTEFHVGSSAVSGWEKTVDGVAWSPTISVTKQVSETFEVVDVISVTNGFVLADAWDPDKLVLTNWSVEPASYASSVVVVSGGLSLNVLFPTQPITLTKTLTVKTCTWSQTLLAEQLTVGLSLPAIRAVTVNKEASDLWLNSINNTPEVYGGEIVTYTLTYGNNGGFEDVADIRSDFPSGVSFVSSDPSPTTGGAGSSTVEWNLPSGLTLGQSGAVTITAQITDDLPVDTALEIPGTILDHAGNVKDTTVVTYQILPPSWNTTINGVPWRFDLGTPISSGGIFTVTNVITNGSDFSLVDRWNADQLSLVSVQQSHGNITNEAGQLTWNVSLDTVATATITCWFRSRSFTETYAVLWEDLTVNGEEWERRPVSLENTTPNILYVPLVFRN